MEHVHLIGADDVRSAGNRMMEAAHQMQRAANEIHEAMRLYQETAQETNAVMADLVEALKQVKP